MTRPEIETETETEQEKLQKDIKQTQAYKNAQLLLEVRCESIADFARIIDRSPSQTYQYVSQNPKKRIGGIIRKRIERAFRLPPHWLTLPEEEAIKSLQNEATDIIAVELEDIIEEAESLKDAPINDNSDMSEVLRKIDELHSAIASLTESVSAVRRIKK